MNAPIDANGLFAQPYVSWKRGGYIVHLPDALGLPAKTFSSHHCSPAQAYADACAYRDRRLPASHKARVLSRQRRNDDTLPALRGVTARSRMSFGRPGIAVVRTSGTESDLVRASARDHSAGSHRTQSFSINRYGFETTLRYAIRKRLSWERTLYGHISRLSESDWVRFMLFAHAARTFPRPVLYVMGNHEYFGHDAARRHADRQQSTGLSG